MAMSKREGEIPTAADGEWIKLSSFFSRLFVKQQLTTNDLSSSIVPITTPPRLCHSWTKR